MIPERTLPQNTEAEIVTIGSMLLDPMVIPDVRTIVRAGDFVSRRCQLVFEAVCRHVDEDDGDLDAVRLQPRLTDQRPYDRLDLPGQSGDDFIIAVLSGVPSTASAVHYAGMVRNAATLRGIIALCERAGGEAHDVSEDAAAFLERLEGEIYALRRAGAGGGLIHIGKGVDMVLEHAEAVSKGDVPPGLMTGIRSVDTAIAGFEPGDLAILAGATSSGKTALADTFVRNIGLAGGIVLIVSAEMMGRERSKRLLQGQANVPGQFIKLAKSLRPEQWTALAQAAEELRNTGIWIYAAGRIRPCDAAMQARRVASKAGGLDLVVVDYLQLLTPTESCGRESTAARVGRMAWELKAMAMELRIPVLLLSQLNREGVKRGNPPTLYALKESGDIENHANTVLLLHRSDPWDRPSECWLKVAKSRDGIVTPWPPSDGGITLGWRAETTTFYDIADSCRKETPDGV